MGFRGILGGVLALGSLYSIGCQGIPSHPAAVDRIPDDLQRAILDAPVQGESGGAQMRDAGAVLKLIPPGTHVEQALMIMQGHGFQCEDVRRDTPVFYLLCRASSFEQTVIEVRIYYRTTEVTRVEVLTHPASA